MNVLVSVEIFFLFLGILLIIRRFLLNHSLVRVMQCKPQGLGLSVLWLYRGRLVDIVFLALTISLRVIWFVDIWFILISTLISACSLICFVYIRNHYQKSFLFASGVALQMAFWFLLGMIIHIIMFHQFSTISFFYLFGWLIYDFGVIYLLRKKVY